jgi:hypothetical protein
MLLELRVEMNHSVITMKNGFFTLFGSENLRIYDFLHKYIQHTYICNK